MQAIFDVVTEYLSGKTSASTYFYAPLLTNLSRMTSFTSLVGTYTPTLKCSVEAERERKKEGGS